MRLIFGLTLLLLLVKSNLLAHSNHLLAGNFFPNYTEELTEKDIAYFKNYEIRLQAIQKKLFSEKNDEIRLQLNEDFNEILDTVLSAEKSFFYPFDSLNEITRLYSPDKFFRIINWNIYKKDGSYLYFGFIQTYDLKKKTYDYFKLQNHPELVKSFETFVGSPEKWLGMLYYKIIKNDNYYTLLGWDGNNKITQKKYIDVLYFKKNGEPVFGKDVFKFPRKNPRRIVFQYSADVVMSLKYHEDKQLIIFDHLAPKESFMEGQYQFYGPDFSFDGFEYHKQKWKFVEDVDIKNIKTKNDNIRRKESKKEKPIYVPH
jgi:hypothetical protein